MNHPYRTRVRAALVAVIVGSALLAPALPVQAVGLTLTVNDDGDVASNVAGDGVCEATLGVGDCTLRAAIEEANASPERRDTIVLPAGDYVLGGSQLEITGDLVIQGAGAATTTVDADGSSRVFRIGGHTSAGISDVTITGGSAGSGGGLYLEGGSSDAVVLDLVGVVVTGNEATSNGGGIYADRNSIVTVVDSRIDDNETGGAGGGMYAYYANLTLVDSTVDDNESGWGAGGVYNSYGNVDALRTSISRNEATATWSSGGGYYGDYASLTITDGWMDDNHARQGGAVYNYEGQAHYTGTSLDGNTAGQYGGTLYGEYGTDILIDSPITNSGLNSTTWMYGGAIYVEYGHNLELVRSPISDTTNVTTSGGLEGGAIRAYEARVSLEDSPITNTASSGMTSTTYGGALYLEEAGFIESGDNSITGTTVTSSSGVYGGAVYLEEGGGAFSGDAISDTTVTTSSWVDGGVMYLEEAGVQLTGMTFDNNTTNSGSCSYGGVIESEYGGLTIRGSTFTNNVLAGTGGSCGYGGALYLYYTGTLIEDSVFENNTTTYKGGAVSWYESGVVVRRSEFRDNSVFNPASAWHDTYGGAFGSDGYGSLLIEDSLLEGNWATYQGGAVYAEDSPVIIRDSQVLGNAVDDQEENDSAYGGAIYLEDESPLILTRSNVSGNTAIGDGDVYGGAIYAEDSPVSMRDSLLEGNVAVSRDDDAYGGAVYLYDYESPVSIWGSTFASNHADGDVDGYGGAIYADETNVVATNSTFSGNTATTEGGGVYAYDASFRFHSVTGVQNSAAGGGFAYNDGGTLVFGHTLLQDNTPGTCDGDARSHGWNIADDDSCGLAETGDQEDTTAAYSALADNGGLTPTHALPAGSAAINAGSAVCTTAGGVLQLTLDQRGLPRPVGSACDVGAFERQPAGGTGGATGGGSGDTTPSGPTTERTADNATAADPVAVAVTSPAGGPVTLAIQETDLPAPDGWAFLGLQVDISAPDATPEDPLILEFRLHGSTLPDDVDHATVAVFRDGVGPVADCAGATTADPDPCASGREQVGDEIVLTVLTSRASVWNFGVTVEDESVPPGPPPVAEACPAGAVPPAGFVDVPPTNVHGEAIDCVVRWGIALGTTKTTYSPVADVTRAQMASFLGRVLDLADVQVTPSRDYFTDDDGNVHESQINRLAEAGIVRGLTATTYGPNQPVTRAQMASFLVRTYEYIAVVTLPVSRDYFTDTAGRVHETNINKAAEAGFALGRTATTYDPWSNVRRDQMASFLTRVLERLVAEGLVPAR